MFLKCAKKQFTKRKFKYYFAAVYLNLSIEVLHLFDRTKLKHHLQIMPDCMHVDCFIFYMFELLLILFSLNKKDKAYISDTICFSHGYHFYFLCFPWKHLYLKHCIHRGLHRKLLLGIIVYLMFENANGFPFYHTYVYGFWRFHPY